MNADPPTIAITEIDDVAPALGEAIVHCWLFSLDEEASDGALDEVERARAARFHFDRDRRRFVAGRDRIRRILARYVNEPPESIAFETGEHGRPALARGPVNFNYSRSENRGLLAVSYASVLGADIEAVRMTDDLGDVARQNFSPAEQRALNALAPADWANGFFACWTRKEAVLKAAGTGLRTPLQAFDVTLAPGEAPAIVRAEGETTVAAGWNLVSFKPLNGYQAAIATDLAAPKLHLFRVEF
jgi:4'-phosphopantetheinyl transferase